MPETSGLLAANPAATARLVIAIGAYRALHGVGPTWRQANRAARWGWRDNVGRDSTDATSDELARRMHVLRRAGLVTFTNESRSLDVTAAGRRFALATLAVGRDQELA